MVDFDEDPTIPCEICGIHVPFTDYISHMEICQHRNSILNMLNPMLNSFIQANSVTAINSNVISSSNLRMINLEDLVDSYEMNNIISELIGRVDHGVIDLNHAISTVDFDEVIDSDNKSCSVCLELFENMDSNAISKTACNHYFCTPCITKWLKSNRTCPLCCFDFNEQENHQMASNDLTCLNQ